MPGYTGPKCQTCKTGYTKGLRLGQDGPCDSLAEGYSGDVGEALAGACASGCLKAGHAANAMSSASGWAPPSVVVSHSAGFSFLLCRF
jgi:hypothetical protein